MCAVFAVFSRGAPIDRDRLDAALGRLKHRGPDASGAEIDATHVRGWFGSSLVQVGLAHARLSILDLAHRSDQPFRVGAVRLVYNGEIYNYRALKQERFSTDARFETTGDTEVLARLLDRLGPACLPELDGMWAFCALDERHARAIAARDRPVGLLLSGGVDSSLILSVLVARGLYDQVHCYIGDTGTSDDADYAQRCVVELSVAARTIRLDYGAASFDRFLRMCAHQAKPFPLLGNSMAMAEMYDAIARDGVPVVLDGTGADEVFGGYWDRYYRFAVADALRAGDSDWLAESLVQNADDALIAGYGRAGLRLAAGRPAPPPSPPNGSGRTTATP